jgi:plastocyanin
VKFLLLILTMLLSAWTHATPVNREVSVIVTKEGYYPNSVTVFQGETVKFFVTSTVEAPDCFLIQGHEVFLAANKGKITEGQTKFNNPGTYSFYCPSSKHQGKVTVIRKSVPQPVRKMASENDSSVWIPKDYE